jgi:hypothetical protein
LRTAKIDYKNYLREIEVSAGGGVFAGILKWMIAKPTPFEHGI